MEFVLFEGVPTMYMFLLNHATRSLRFVIASLLHCGWSDDAGGKNGRSIETELNKTILNFNFLLISGDKEK